MQRFRVMGLALGLAAGLVAGATQVRADVILGPGLTVNAGSGFVTQTNNPFGGLLAGPTTITSTGPASGISLTQAVFRDATTGNTDFAFQVSNPGTATGAVTSITLNNYTFGLPVTAYTTSVGTLAGTGVTPSYPAGFASGSNLVAVTQAQRGVTGAEITFSFDSTAGLAAGSTSQIFFVRTNAPSFNSNGTSAVQAVGANGTFSPLFQPAGTPAAVPEPTTVVGMLLGVPFLGLVGYRSLRRRPA